MAPAYVTGEALRPFLRGAPFLSFVEGRAALHRLDLASRAYPVDAWEHARTSAGVRLELTCSAPELRVRLRYVEVRSRPEASLWQGGKRLAVFDPQGKAGDHEASFTLPSGAAPLTLYLPYNSVVEVAGIGPAEAIAPVPGGGSRAAPLWIAFGDSITHGNNATDPGHTYPAIASRLLGIDHWNVGFAGAARGEPPVAEALAAMPAGVISLAFGTNLMRYGLFYDRPAWREVFRNFIEIIRKGHPDTPLLVITPIYRSAANAETTPNARGLTQRDIRAVEDEVAKARQAAGDRHLHVLSGLDVLGEAGANLLGDGIHPGDVGMELMGKAVAAALRPLIG